MKKCELAPTVGKYNSIWLTHVKNNGNNTLFKYEDKIITMPLHRRFRWRYKSE